MIHRLRLAVMAALLMFAQTSIAAVWQPTDNDINASAVFSTSGATFAIFDDSDTTLSNPLLEFVGGDIIAFAGTTISKVGSSPLQTASLTGDQRFRLAAFIGGAWRAEVAVTQDTATAYLITFRNTDEPLSRYTEKLYLNDVTPYTPVPEPSAVLMLLLGLGGLQFLRRRA